MWWRVVWAQRFFSVDDSSAALDKFSTCSPRNAPGQRDYFRHGGGEERRQQCGRGLVIDLYEHRKLWLTKRPTHAERTSFDLYPALDSELQFTEREYRRVCERRPQQERSGPTFNHRVCQHLERFLCDADTGVDATGFPYHFAGVVALDGNGNVTNGEQTYTDYAMSSSDAITGGRYSIGPDGRGTITLNTTNQNIGQAGIEVFSLVVLSSSNLLIAKLDDASINTLSTSTAAGTMDLQTTTIAAPTAGYAFVVNGTDVTTLSPTAFGGILNIDSPGGVSGNGSVADQDVGGAVTTNSLISGTISAPTRWAP